MIHEPTPKDRLSSASTVPKASAATRSSSSIAATAAAAASAAKLNQCSRTRLLNRLGYFQPPTAAANDNKCNKASSSSSPSSLCQSLASSVYASTSVSILGSVRPSQTSLNDANSSKGSNNTRGKGGDKNHRQPFFRSSSSTLNSTHTTSGGKSASGKSSVRFDDVVMVMSIPSRHHYSDRIRCVLWSGRDELYEMSQRNVVEFQAEGWDWRTVVEDEDMYIDVHTGQKLHPCHYDLHYQQQHGQQHQQDYDDEESSSDEEDGDDDDFAFKPLTRQQSSAFILS